MPVRLVVKFKLLPTQMLVAEAVIVGAALEMRIFQKSV
jgi:hypothetical protein